jgi:hypothetical protein
MLRPKGTMSLELWRKCADEIAQVSPATECWFSGSGEPLVETNLACQMISHGKSAGLRSLHLNTNGTLLTTQVARRILDSGVDVIVIGVDGFSKATYEGIRVGGCRDELFSNIEGLLGEALGKSHRPDIQLQFIEMDENLHEIEDFKRYWLDRGVTVKVRRKLSWGGRLETPSKIPPDQRIPCPWAITLMHVLWDGRVPRCAGDTEGKDCVGNAMAESLVELWARLAPHRQLHLDRRFDEVSEQCQLCKDWMTGASERVRPSERSVGEPWAAGEASG